MNHKHFCPDCLEETKWWEHDRLEGCIIEDCKQYPCIEHIMNHIIILSLTPEEAKRVYEEGL